jgi:hypothetical protein
MPRLLTVVPLAMPLEKICSRPPLSNVLMSVPPEMTFRVPPLKTMTPLLVWPEEMVRV